MPMTPLHIGVLAPLNHFAPGKVSAASFILTQLCLDGKTIVFYLTGYGGVDHSSHTLVVALVLGALIGLFGFWSARWVWGAFVGTFSHVVLDALVHTDVFLMDPWRLSNVLYMDGMEPLSLVLLALSAWWLLQKISAFLKWYMKHRAPAVARPAATFLALAAIQRLRASPFIRQWRWHLGRATVLLAIVIMPFLFAGR